MSNPHVCTLNGEFFATRQYGREIRERIEAAAAPDVEVVIDFRSVESATLGFLDELVCNLAASHPVTVRGMNKDVAECIDLAVRRRELGGRVTRG
jgi:hypothetical protein